MAEATLADNARISHRDLTMLQKRMQQAVNDGDPELAQRLGRAIIAANAEGGVDGDGGPMETTGSASRLRGRGDRPAPVAEDDTGLFRRIGETTGSASRLRGRGDQPAPASEDGSLMWKLGKLPSKALGAYTDFTDRVGQKLDMEAEAQRNREASGDQSQYSPFIQSLLGYEDEVEQRGGTPFASLPEEFYPETGGMDPDLRFANEPHGPHGPEYVDPSLFDPTGGMDPDPDRPFTIEPQGADAFGVPTSPEQAQEGAAAGDKVMGADSGRGGDVASPFADIPDGEVADYEPDQRPLHEGGIFPKARGKVLDFLGVDDQDHADRLGMMLMGFGTGVLGGGSDIGEAIGAGFAKGADQFVKTKKGQREAGLEDYDRAVERADRERTIAIEDEKLSMAAEKFDEWRAQTARARTEREDNAGIVKLERKINEAGLQETWDQMNDPDYVAPPEDAQRYSSIVRWLESVEGGSMSGDELKEMAGLIFTGKYPTSDGLAQLIAQQQGD